MIQDENNESNKTKEDNQLDNLENKNPNQQSKNELITKASEISKKLLESKNNFMEKINNYISNLGSNYDNYISNITNISNDLTNDTLKNEEDIKKNFFHLKNIFENIEELQNNILENIDNLNDFFIQNDSNKPKKKKEKDNILKINSGADIRTCQKKLEKNKIEKIVIKELASNILEEIFLPNIANNEGDMQEELAKKEYNDIIIKKSNLENVNFSKLFPIVNKFKLKKCQISFDSKSFFNFDKISELYLENIGLVNETFNTILSDLKNNINFINNIKIFSIKCNNISIFNLNFTDTPSNKKYNNLQLLNLSNNKIGKINSDIFNLLPSIKVIDLTNNNFAFNSRYNKLLDISKNINCIVLLAKNPSIVKEKNREEYCNYLQYIIPKLTNDYPLKVLNLEGIFCGKTYPLLLDLNIANINNNNLVTLNLSYNNLNDQDLIKIIGNDNNSIFSSIKKLVLCSNYITEVGLNNLINEEHNKKFINLKKLDLSGNPIKYNDLNQFKNFLIGFPKMKTLLLRHTPIEKDFNNYLKINVMRISEVSDTKEGVELSPLELQFEKMAKEHFLKEKTKLTIKIMNTIGYKNLSELRKFAPYLLENIKIETKFIDEDRIYRIMNYK